MRYAISDIHGCPKTFRLALERINFSHDDELFLLGDYVDRGPDSMGAIEAIWELEKAGYQMTCLRGNHEQMFLDAMMRGESSDEIPRQYQEQVARWMLGLGHYVETPGYFLVHAGLNFRSTDYLWDTNAMMWIRYWYDDIDLNWLGDRVIVHGHSPARMLEVSADIRHMQENQVVGIDTGCSQLAEGMGYLTVLNLDTRQGTFVRMVD